MRAQETVQDRHAEQVQQFATFHVAEMLMGIELSLVQELMRSQEMASIPLAPNAVVGLINLRGQIVTALDMRRIFGFGPLKNCENLPMNIIIGNESGVVSLLVDEICDVVDVAPAACTELPGNLAVEQRSMLKTVYQLEGSLLLILDAPKVISRSIEEMPSTGGFGSKLLAKAAEQ